VELREPMKLSTKARYALRSMVVISRLSQNGEPVSLERIARRTSMSRGYLEQLASKLKRASLVRAITGRRGGYFLTRAPEEINLGQIVEAVIGPIGIVDCVLDPDSCAISDYCECRPVYCTLNDKIKRVLCEFSLAELASGTHQALPGTKRNALE